MSFGGGGLKSKVQNSVNGSQTKKSLDPDKLASRQQKLHIPKN
jgi:hypothetical protein